MAARVRQWPWATARTTWTCCGSGSGVAFHAKPIVAATVGPGRYADLRALLFAQGYRAGEFVNGCVRVRGE